MKTVNAKNYKAFVKKEGLRAILFTKKNDAKCKGSKAALVELSELDAEFATAELKDLKLRKDLDVRFAPTLVVFNEGEVLEKLELVPADEAEALYGRVLKSYLPKEEVEESGDQADDTVDGEPKDGE